MGKTVALSLPEYIIERTLNKNPGKNRSEWAAELLLLGIEKYERKEKNGGDGVTLARNIQWNSLFSRLIYRGVF